MTSMDLSKGSVPAPVTTQKSDKSILLHYAKQKLRDNLKISIVATILHFVAVPLILITIISNIALYNKEEPNEFISVIGTIATICAGLIGIVSALSTFNYLYKKSNVDMVHSLPMSSNGRFITDFITGFLSYVVPFIVNQILALILFGIGLLAFDGKPLIYDSYSKSFSNCTIFSEAFPYYIKLALGGLVVMLFLYTVTVFVTTCCGTVFESAVYTILFNGIVPATISVVLLVLCNDIYGINFESTAFKLLSWTSPAGSAFGLLDWISKGEISSTESPTLIAWLLPVIIVIAAFIGLTFYLYKKRKAENVGKPFVFKIFYYVIITCITFCIGCIFLYEIRENSDYGSDTSGMYMPFVIITAITYLIFEVVTNRGFKKFWLSIIRYASTLVCVAGLYFLVVNTGGFGAETRVPSALSVMKVTISYDGYFDLNEDRYYDSENKGQKDIVLKNKDNIQTVIDAHTSRIDNFKKYGEEFIYNNRYFTLDRVDTDVYTLGSYYGDFEITYTLISGRTIKRTYDRISYDEAEILKNLDFTEEFREQYIDNQIVGVKNSLNSMKLDYENNTRNHYNDNNDPTIRLNGMFTDTEYIQYSSLPSDFSDQLCNALRTDLTKETAEMYFTPEKPMVCELQISYFSIKISPYYTNTLNLLSRYSDLNFEADELEALSLIQNKWIYLISYEDYKNLTGSAIINTNVNVYENSQNHFILTYSDDVKTLLNVAKTQYITNEMCYTIIVNNQLAVIPPEYNYIADRVYKYTGNPYEEDEYYYEKYNNYYYD